MLDQHHWQATRETAYIELQQPTKENVKTALILEFHQMLVRLKNGSNLTLLLK
ncbi:Uncharacterised protein [Klebsiella pneumoniae]|uniref:Uncharacterized protein n=1 Tax=Klebsiella pneumoniae TaxID=573 RepID=A0A377X721_KLEPN|nr:Uncharacterised protein [Klebsiella pneumoniae]